MSVSDTKILLGEDAIPRHWYNVIPDLPEPPGPYLGPDGAPVPASAMEAIFPPATAAGGRSGRRRPGNR